MPNQNKLYVRQVLLSTGELTVEAVIRIGDVEFCGVAPVGLTVGIKEKMMRGSSISRECNLLKLNKYKNITELTQKEFDNLVNHFCSNQISVAFSLAYLNYIAYKNGFTEKQIFKFFRQKFNKHLNFPSIISNLLNGGKHSFGALSFCEFMIIPHGVTVDQNIKIVSEVYLDLKDIITKELGIENLYLGREGGFAPLIADVEIAISLINRAILKRNQGMCKIAIDVAANNFAKLNNNGKYIYSVNDHFYTTDDFLNYYLYLVDKFPMIEYFEDPFHENDLIGWKKIMSLLGDEILIVADDLTNSSLYYLKKYHKFFNACILKVNQAGSVSKLIESYEFCVKNGIKTIISQRSGETDSNIIAHLASGLGSDYFKAGAPARERIVKYNELIRISHIG